MKYYRVNNFDNNFKHKGSLKIQQNFQTALFYYSFIHQNTFDTHVPPSPHSPALCLAYFSES